MLHRANVYLARAFVAMCSGGLMLFIGGIWAESEAAANAGVALFFTSGAPLVLFVPLLIIEAVRLADGSSQPQRGC